MKVAPFNGPRANLANGKDMESRTGPKHEEQGKEIREHCQECARETTHTIVASAEFVTDLSDRDFSMQLWDEYQAIECRGCQALRFRHCNRHTERTDHDPETGEEFLVPSVTSYPERSSGRGEMQNVDLLPLAVLQIYQETLSALNGGMRVLAGIGIRALVETMCKDRKAKGRDLEKRIDDLVSQGVVARGEAEILHSLRIMGNQAAHEVLPHTVGDLSTALDVIEHALLGIYVLPHQAAQLPRRKTLGGPTTT